MAYKGIGQTVDIPFPQYDGTVPVPDVTSTLSFPQASSFDWGNLFNTGVNTASSIFKSMYGGPQPGQYFSVNPKTGQMESYALPQGSSVSAFPGPSITSSSLSSWIPIIGIGIVGVFALKAMFGHK